MSEIPVIIEGGRFEDERGSMRFVNDLLLEDVKRFYFIKHTDTSTIRAWQGHVEEKKYFYPISGRFAVVWVKIDDFENPSDELIPEFHILDANKSEIVCVPKGYANGLKALDSNSEILVFSDMNLEESVNEKIRFESSKWFDWQSLKPLSKTNDH